MEARKYCTKEMKNSCKNSLQPAGIAISSPVHELQTATGHVLVIY